MTTLKVKTDTEILAFLLEKMGGMTKSSIKNLLANRQVKQNGKVITHFMSPLAAGDVVTIDSTHQSEELRHPKLRIVYEDDYLIVVEKKVGLLTVAVHDASRETTCLSILKSYVKKSNRRGNVYVVHRLDRETSGLLVFAKDEKVQNYMREYWRQIVTCRTYVAVTDGIPEPANGTIKSYLTEDKRQAMVYSSHTPENGGKLAITHYKTLKANGLNALVELHLETGRTNQIRVHLKTMGCPVHSDHKYGISQGKSSLDRLALHARVLEFIHPVTEKKMHFETPVPVEFSNFVNTKNK